MTAPEPAFTVHDDADGEPTLWYGDLAVQRRCELAPTTRVGTPAERAERDALRDRMWAVLTAVLAPDEATVERLAMALIENSWPGASWEHADERAQLSALENVKVVLAALAGTSAQARHTAVETGGGEHG